MATPEATPDMRLVVGVDIGLSFSSMKDGISKVIEKIEKESPPRIKIQFDDTEINKKVQSLRSQITEISNQKVSIGATGELQSTLTTISSSLENLSQKIVSIGDSANFNNLTDSLKSITPVIENLKSELASLKSATQNFQGVNLNIGFTRGNSMSAESVVKRSAITELREQADALEEVYMKYTKTSQGLVGVTQALKGTSIAVKNNLFYIKGAAADPTANLTDQITALQKWISVMKEGAKLKGIDISPVLSKFSSSADEIVNKVNKVVSGEQSLEDQTNKLKEIFSSGVNSDALNTQLTTINDSINRVSSSIANLKIDGSSLNTFVESVNKLSGAIESLISAMDSVTNRNASMSEGITSVARAAQKASASLGEYRVSLDEGNRKILSDNLPLNSSKIDDFVRRLANLSITAQSVKARWEETAETGQMLTRVIVDGSNAQNDAVKHTIEFDKKTGDVSREFTEVVHKAKAVKEEIKGAGDASDKSNNKTKETEANLESIEGILKEIQTTNNSITKSYGSVQKALGGVNSSGLNASELDNIKNKFIDLQTATNNLKKSRQTATQEDVNNIRNLQSEIMRLIQLSYDRIEAEKAASAAQSQKQNTQEIDFTIAADNAEASLVKIRRRFSELKEPSEEVRTSISNLENAFTRFNTTSDTNAKEQALKDISGLISVANKRLSEQEYLQRKASNAEKEANREATRNIKNQNSAEQEANKQRKIALELLAKITKAQQEWTKARSGSTSNEYAKLSTYINEINSALNGLSSKSLSSSDFVSRIKTINTEFAQTSAAIKNAGENTLTLRDRFGALGEKFTMWFSATQLIMQLYSNLKQMISITIELDKTMNQLQIVTKNSDDVMEHFGNTVADSAKKVGSSITDFISSTTTFARLGYSLDESSKLAEFTAMLQNVGNIDANSAQEAMTSIIKAFNIDDMKNVELVLDKLVKTGNSFPISVGDIAEGMKNASSALAAAGNSYDQSVALLTAANTTIQNAAKSSTGLRTIAARIRKTKTELDELGESMTDADYEQIVQALTNLNVSLKDSNGEFRSTYDIIKDIAAQWDTLSSMEQAGLAEKIAGTRIQSIFYSLVGQFKEATGAMDSMANSAGELSEANNKYLETAEAHINQLKVSYEGLAKSLFESDSIKTVVDSLSGLLNLLDGLVKTIGGVPTILTGIAAALSAFKNVGRGK